ncbi:TonB-dependent receptor [Litorimonas cladophorae]|uniref:TonB-dependent receptor n=1 Tax=Litorimonas cladophorae TaxID=1220491 RepID=A0A918NC95_9PROT|nr:TonB-dependent receptor [Litorimonas cladophorae]GGX57141.1 TonB-dependent receptor [Litorimonas cladophorae]
MKTKSSTAVDKLSKLSLLGTTALIASFGMMPMAYAQDADTAAVEDGDVVVATGIRQSLKEARDLKRDADTAVDSITASDVGSLPDLSVAEALARIPGVVAQRFDITSGNGGDFPSPEGGGNLIRGLTLVSSQFNGRESFSANGGRALDFGTVPPELIGAVDVFKNTTADMLEGGIGGTINLRTLEPFDKQGLVAVINADATYTDLRDEWSPEYSILLGNRWETGAGEFGILGSFASSELKSELHGFQIGQVIPFATPTGTIGLPSGVQLRTNEVDRARDSYYIAGQWQNPSGDLRLTAKYSRIENDTDSDERTLEFFSDGEMWQQFDIQGLTTTPFESTGLAQCNGSNDPTPANPTCEVTQPVSGLYESGLISNSLRDWTGARGANFSNLGIHQQDKSTTDDMSLNIKWRPSDRLFVNLDAHRTTAEFSTQRLWNGSRFFSDFELDADIDNPGLRLITDPTNNPNRRPAGLPAVSGDLSNPDSAFLLFAADEFRDNDGEMYAVRGDVEYEFDNDGWFDAIKFGARYADREQTNRQAGLNWAAVAAPWAGGYLPFSELNTPGSEAVDFTDFFRGGVVTGDNTNVVFADRGLLQDYDAFVAAMASDPNVPNGVSQFGTPQYGDWAPLRTDGVVDFSRGQTGNVREKTTNLYTRLDFGKEFDSGLSLEGNVGLRYVRTENSSDGTLAYAEISDNPSVDENGVEIPNSRPSFFSPETIAFYNQVDEALFAKGTDERWLPSLNLKWNLSDQSLVRFGVSKVITRPNIADLRVDGTLSGQGQFIRDPDLAENETGAPLDIRYLTSFRSGGNPNLKPTESVNWDLSYERYFGDNNSFSVAVFRKDIENNIIDASQTQGSLSLDGNTVPIVYTGKLNQDESTVQGVEIAYQQFFDQWPGLLGNLGVQANYTYVSANANPPAGSVDANGDGAPDSFERIYRYGVDNFLGLSEDSVNLIGIYQDDKLEMRLAYNWRSEYLGSYRDFVTGNPIFQQPTGYLDGSIKYDITENFQVRAQVANITDEKANAEQQIDAAGQRFGRTSFVGDRRIKVGARYAF